MVNRENEVDEEVARLEKEIVKLLSRKFDIDIELVKKRSRIAYLLGRK